MNPPVAEKRGRLKRQAAGNNISEPIVTQPVSFTAIWKSSMSISGPDVSPVWLAAGCFVLFDQ